MATSLVQSDARPIGDQVVAGSIPAGSGNIRSLRVIMKYFLPAFSTFRWLGQLSVPSKYSS